MQKKHELKKVSVVMRHHNAFDLTEHCLKSLQQQNYLNINFLVVDDYSTDQSVKKLKKIFKDVTFLSTSKYVEYSIGLNIGIRHALKNGSDYIFVINNDTKNFSKDLIKKMVQVFKNDSSIGLVGCKVYDYDGSVRWDGSFKDKLGVRMLSPTEGYMISKKTFNIVGLLDEKLVRYFEDLDYLIKLKNNNIKVGFVKDAYFEHLGHGTSSKQAFIPPYYRARNLIWFLKTCCKHKNIIWKVKRYIIYSLSTLSRMNYFIKRRTFQKIPIFLLAFILGTFVGAVSCWKQKKYV